MHMFIIFILLFSENAVCAFKTMKRFAPATRCTTFNVCH